MAVFLSNSSRVLFDGEPQAGVVAKGDAVYYKYWRDGKDDLVGLTVTVTALVGDPDVYVVADGEDPETAAHPGPTYPETDGKGGVRLVKQYIFIFCLKMCI